MYSQDYFATLKTRGNRQISDRKDLWDRYWGLAIQQLGSYENIT